VRRPPTKDLVISCVIFALFFAVVMAMTAMAGAAEPTSSPFPLFAEIALPSGQGGIAFTPGQQTGQTVLVLRTSQGLQFFTVATVGSQPTPTPTPELTGLAKDTRDWAAQLVPADGRAAEAKRLAAGYRTVGDRATKGEFTALTEVQNAQAVENRKALGIPLEDAQAGKTNRWYPVIVKLAEYLKSHPPADPKAMGPVSLDIAKGLEAVQ
jgi:hypothetical protein